MSSVRQDRISSWSLFLKPSMYISTVPLFSVISELQGIDFSRRLTYRILSAADRVSTEFQQFPYQAARQLIKYSSAATSSAPPKPAPVGSPGSTDHPDSFPAMLLSIASRKGP